MKDKKNILKTIFKAALTIGLVVVFVLTLFLSDYAIEEETVSYDVMSKWIGYDIISGDNNGDIGEFNKLKKVDAITIINRINNLDIEIKKEEEKYKDVESFRWYYSEIEKGVATGIITGAPDGKINPNDYLTREEAFSVIAKFFNITYKGNSDAKEYLSNIFLDGKEVGRWSSSYLAGLVEAGYIKISDDKLLRSKEHITKLEFIEVIDNLVGMLINKPGTYDLSNVKGRVVINVNNVKLKNLNEDILIYLAAGSNEEVEILDNELIIEEDIPETLVIGSVVSNTNYDVFKPTKSELFTKKLNTIKASYIMPVAENLTSTLGKKYYNRVKGTDKWNDLILKIAKEEDIDPTFVKCIMAIESSGTSGVKSKMNKNGTYDYGLMQVNTGWGNSFNYQRMLEDNEYAIRSGVIVIKRKIEAAEASGKKATIHEVAWRYNGYSEKGYEYANTLSTIYEELTGNSRLNTVRLTEKLLKIEK